MVCSIFIASRISSGAPFPHRGAGLGDQRDHLAGHRGEQAALGAAALARVVQRVDRGKLPGPAVAEDVAALAGDDHRGGGAQAVELGAQRPRG
jgi:hypothetical protein